MVRQFAFNEIKSQLPDLFLAEPNKELYTNNSNFDVEFDTWVDSDSIIMAFSVREEQRSVKIIVQHPEDKKYSLIRIFPIGLNWQTSVDMNHVSPETIFDRLLSY